MPQTTPRFVSTVRLPGGTGSDRETAARSCAHAAAPVADAVKAGAQGPALLVVLQQLRAF